MALPKYLGEVGNKWARLVGHSITALVGLAAVVLTALLESRQITDATWVFWSTLLAGTIVFVQSLAKGWRDIWSLSEKTRRDLEKTVLATLLSVNEETTIRVQTLGGSIFKARRPWWLFGSKRLKRILRYRLTDYPPPSNLPWTTGMGAIGQAFKNGDDARADWTSYSAAFNMPHSDKMAVCRGIPEDQRFGMDDNQLFRMVGKYAESLAVPIFNGNQTKVVGAFAIDVPYTEERRGRPAELGTFEIKALATVAARQIGLLLDPKE